MPVNLFFYIQLSHFSACEIDISDKLTLKTFETAIVNMVRHQYTNIYGEYFLTAIVEITSLQFSDVLLLLETLTSVTHWNLVSQIFHSAMNWVIFGSSDGLSPMRYHTIAWNDDEFCQSDTSNKST